MHGTHVQVRHGVIQCSRTTFRNVRYSLKAVRDQVTRQALFSLARVLQVRANSEPSRHSVSD
eukprot:2354330-Rhodomonas_salina.1